VNPAVEPLGLPLKYLGWNVAMLSPRTLRDLHPAGSFVERIDFSKEGIVCCFEERGVIIGAFHNINSMAGITLQHQPKCPPIV